MRNRAISSPGTNPAIRLRSVSKDYKVYTSVADQAIDVLGLSPMFFWRKRAPKRFSALRGIDLEIARGERVGIIGRNGAGKTTLLKLISGNFAQTAGDIEVDGEVQALMQTGLGFHGEFTGAENIRASLFYNGLSGPGLEEAFEDVVAFCELGDFIDQPVKTYSLGMRSRLQFATATAIKPDILIVDEVLGAGDAYFAVKSSDRMKRLTGSGCTLILVSHSMSQVIQFCERVVWIKDGRIERDGAARDVVGAYEVYCAELARSNRYSEKLIADNNRTAHNEGAKPALLDDGTEVYRWPSEEGVKISSFELRTDGVRTQVFVSMRPLECLLKVRSEVDGPIDCQYFVSFFSFDGRRVTRLASNPHRINGRVGDVHTVRILLDPLRLGQGDYFVNVSVFEPVDASRVAGAKRYDLLSRFYDFRVNRFVDYQEPVLFYHDACWDFGADSENPHGGVVKLGTVG